MRSRAARASAGASLGGVRASPPISLATRRASASVAALPACAIRNAAMSRVSGRQSAAHRRAIATSSSKAAAIRRSARDFVASQPANRRRHTECPEHGCHHGPPNRTRVPVADAATSAGTPSARSRASRSAIVATSGRPRSRVQCPSA